jgi:hypothetical protein
MGPACPSVGHYYVTQVVLARPLAGRKLTGLNHEGVVVHLGRHLRLLPMSLTGLLQSY